MTTSPEGGTVEKRLFGPEWYAFLPHQHCLVKRRVVNRRNVPAGSCYFDEELECGHVVRRVTGLYDARRCPECMPRPPWLDRTVVIVEDAVVPYEPGNPRKKG